MKVFKFDPITGTRGEQVDTARRASWASSRMSNYEGAEPRGFGRDAEVTVHCDAGITDATGATDISYRHATEWRCFCLGCWHVGEGQDHWEWVVIPPASIDARYYA